MELLLATIVIFQMGFGFFSVVTGMDRQTEKLKQELRYRIEGVKRDQKEYDLLKEANDILSMKVTEYEMREKEMTSTYENLSAEVTRLQSEHDKDTEMLRKMISELQARNTFLVAENKKLGEKSRAEISVLNTQITDLRKQNSDMSIKRPGKAKSFFKKQ